MRGLRTSKEKLEVWTRTICGMLKQGASLRSACDIARIPYSTILDYYANNEVIRAEIDGAKAQYQYDLDKTIYQGALIDPKLALEVKKVRDKDNYSPRIETTGPEGGPIQNNINLEKLTLDELKTLETLTTKASN